jgi:hypothetical protein
VDGALTRSRRQRGAATVEAVIMLPVFVFMLLAVQHEARLYVTALRATSTARRCAFGHAMSGCVRVPEGCPGVGTRTTGTADDISKEADEEAAVALGVASRIGRPFGSLSSFPILGGALTGLFGERTETRVQGSFEGHLPGDRDERHVTGYYVLACNVAPREGGAVADELFGTLMDGL